MSDQFDAPGEDAGIEDDFDPAAAVPNILVRIAGGSLVVAGCFVAASGVQLFAFFTIYDLWIKVWAVLMILMGVAAFPIGGFHFQARTWATFAAAGLAVLLAFSSTLWGLYAVYVGLFSPIMLFGSGCSVLSAIVVMISIPMALRAASARAALYR